MIPKAITWFYRRFQPEDGWLALLLMGAITLLLAYQVTATRWVPEGSIAWLAVISLGLALLLNQRRLDWRPAWLLLLTYGIVFTTLWLGRLWPPLKVIFAGWGASSEYIRQNYLLFVARAGSWLEAVSGGDSSRETLVFAFGLGLLAWIVVAYAAWSTFRRRRPFTGVLVIGLALAFNGFYGRAPLLTLPIFIGLAVLLVANVNLATLQQRWQTGAIDYSTEIRFDLLINGAAVAMLLMALGFMVPEVNLRAVYRAVFDRPAIHQLEAGLERAFAGVQVAGNEGPGAGAGGSAARGRLPRSFLLGDAPELYETIVMTATVSGETAGAAHWRGASYDIYNGRGWSLSSERRESIPAGQPIRHPGVESLVPVNQVVEKVEDGRSLRYTLGRPDQFDQEVESLWRGETDLSRVLGQGKGYTALSSISTAGAETLRQASLAEVPPEILERYTALPDSVPARVQALAQEIAAGPEADRSLYDTVKSLELFLRQYPYSLAVELPPASSDPVDYFLFDLQSGYCDYYASAMVVLARSLGIPARLGTGYLAQAASPDGRQLIYQIDAHSWAEVYFAGYGWLEFEPTAGVASLSATAESASPSGPEEPAPVEYEPPPIPERQRSWAALWWLLLPVALVIGCWWLWRRRRRKGAGLDEAQWVYGRMLLGARRLGQSTPASQTPQEFESALLARLEALGEQRLPRRLEPAQLRPDIQELTTAFTTRQYSPDKRSPASVAENWRRMRWRYGLLGLLYRLARRWPGKR